MNEENINESQELEKYLRDKNYDRENDKYTIKIYDVSKQFDKEMPKYCGEIENQPMVLTNIRAIVIHQDLERDENFFESILPKIIKKNHRNYHFVVGQDGKIFKLNEEIRCVNHINCIEYSKKMTEYFGESVCPSKEYGLRKRTASPNICTISICIPKADENGLIGQEAYNSLQRLCAYLINVEAPYLEAQANILLDSQFQAHPEIEDSKNKSFVTDPTKFRDFRRNTEKLRSRWLVFYGKIHNGLCPPVKIYETTI